MATPLILSIDQGTSSTKCLLVDGSGAVVARGSAPVGESHPQPGWVEQDADAIWGSVREAVRLCLDGQDAARVAAVGLSVQRESAVIWDRRSGVALAPVLSWQDQRTAALCEALRSPENERLVRARSGLPLDPMFTALKARWLFDAVDPTRRQAQGGEICLGTIDSWLLSRVAGDGGPHLIEAGSASRTQLMGVRRAAWDEDLLALFDVPAAALPRITPSVGPFPAVTGLPPLLDGTPILAVLGDSHAALFAHGAFRPGRVKATYGTGSSVMGLLNAPDTLDPGLCLTIAWMIEEPAFAAEGNIRAAGSTLRWVADLLGITTDALADLAAASDSRGVTLVPAFTGLGAPWWDRDATGLIDGLRFGTGRAELARAAFESIPHQVADVIDAVDRSVGRVAILHADGGSTRNTALMQLQADLIGRPVLRSATAELSAMGAAHLAGLGAGLWSWRDLEAMPREHDRLSPRMGAPERVAARGHWHDAVARARRGPEAAGEATPAMRRTLGQA